MLEIEEHQGRFGEHLHDCIEKLLDRARETHRPIRLTFNGAHVDFTEFQGVEMIEAKFEKIWHDQAEAYARSPAGIRGQADMEERVAQAQALHDHLMATRQTAFKSEGGIIDWLEQYSEPADDTRVHGKQFALLAKELEDLGYVNNGDLNRPHEDYLDPMILARYTIGQAINQLESGMPPHPGFMERFAAVYRGEKPL